MRDGEKGRVKIPGAVERMIRAVYDEHIGGNRTVTEILSGLAELDDMVDREGRANLAVST